MKHHSHTEKYKQIIVPIILKHVPTAKIILYGSRARKEESEGSDIDLALDLGKQINPEKLAAIRNDLEESVLPITFDIVDFYDVSEHMQNEIRRDGIIWQL